MSEIIKVGMADLNVCVAPNGITTLGLGSCVGIALRDPVTKIGGLAQQKRRSLHHYDLPFCYLDINLLLRHPEIRI